MSYVDSQLLPGETVTYRGRLHKSIFTIPIIFAVLTVAVLIATFWFSPEKWIALVFGVIALLTYASAYIHYSGSEFAVTNKRVIMKVGFIRRRTLETLMSKVEGIGVNQDLFGRMFNYGTIEVTGTGGTKESFNRISQPLEFRRQVQAAIAAADEARGGSSSAASLPRDERECPFCAERILAKAKVCRFCGKEVPAAT